MTPDFQASLDFLRLIYPDGPWMLTAISVDKKSIEARTFTPKDHEDVLAWLELHKQKNLYYSVNQPIKEAREKRKLSKTDVLSAHFVHVDVDPRAGEDVGAEQNRILARLHDYKIKPTVIVFSGGGYNALWRLDKQVDIAFGSPSPEETIARAIDFERRNWQMEIDFETPDHCRDVSRILRLPGTINRPNAEKVAKGRTPALAKIVHFEDVTYPLSTFMATPHVSANVSSSKEGKVSQDILRIESLDHLGKEVPERVKIIIAQGFDPEDQNYDGDRSSPLFFVCNELVRCGVADNIILGIITDSRFGISASVLDKGSRVMDYAMRQLTRAKDKAFHPKLAEMNEQYAVIEDLGGLCMIMTQHEDGRVTFRRPAEFFKAHDHEKMIWMDDKGKEKKIGLASWWFDQRRRRQYKGVVFEPLAETPGFFNLWTGFAVQPKEGDKHISFLDHMYENICHGKQELFDYLIRWMARVVQQPRTQSMSCPVFLGERGTGKSVFCSYFGMLFGRHTYTASDVHEITGKFNAHLENIVFMIGEEAFDIRDRRHESVLKMRITGASLNVERKTVDISVRNNYIHLVLTSNNEKVIPAGDKERRFLVVRVRDRKMTREEFEKIKADRDSGGLANLLHFLMSIDLTGFDVTDIPATQELREQQEHNLEHQRDWLLEKLETGVWLNTMKTPWVGPVIKTDLYADYLIYAKALNVARPLSLRQFGLWIKREFPDIVDKQLSPRDNASRPWAFCFPTLPDCRAQFLKNRGWKEHEWLQKIVVVEETHEETPPSAQQSLKKPFE